MAYTQLHENLDAEAGKGVLTGGFISMAMHVSMGRTRQWGPKEWSRQPEKWSGRSSLVARNSLRGQGTTRGATTGGVLTEQDVGGGTPIARLC
jgi:hypothetical protein